MNVALLQAVLSIPGTGFELPPEIIVIGLITGLTYGLTAVGLVMVYRVSRVVNFAHGALGALPALVVPYLVLETGLPYAVSLPLGLAVGAGGGALLEWGVIRRLREAPRLIVMVATIAAAQVLGVITAILPLNDGFLSKTYPTPFSASLQIGDLRLDAAKLLVLGVAPIVVIGLAWFQRGTRLGIASRAAAENVEAAWLTGIPVKRVSLIAWTVAGLFAAIAAILVTATQGISSAGTGLGAGLLVRALAAALVGKLDSYPQTFLAGVGIGVVEMLLSWNDTTSGYINVVLLALIVGCLLFRSGLAQAARGGEGSSWSLAGELRALPPHIAAHPFVRWGRWLGIAAFVWVPVLWSMEMTNAQQVLLASLFIFATMGLSLVVLTGFAGQVSLGQATFVGVGAFVAGRTWEMGFPALSVMAYATLITAATALLLGLPALRVRGLFLAVVTIAFAVFAQGWLFGQRWLTTSNGVPTQRLPRGEILGFDLATERHYAWFCILMFVVTAALVHRIRTTGVGRSMIAVRDNEAAAMTLSLSPRRVKLLAFCLAGGIAGMSGWLYGGLLVNFGGRNLSSPDESIQLVVMVILGGVTTISGTVLGALWIKGIPYFLGSEWGLVSSALGVLAVLLYLRGGLATLAFRIRDRVVTFFTGMALDEVVESSRQAGVSRRRLAASPMAGIRSDRPLLEARNVVVRFGGNIAVNDVSLTLREGEVLGILGPNGAGKTTLFDVLTGQVRPAAGQVLLQGADVTKLRPDQRAQLLMGRTFQQARLFDDLTLFECMQVALERESPTEVVPSLLGLPPSRRAERAKQARARELIEMLGLEPYANRPMTALSTGTRRMAELAAVVAMGAKVVLLDEPTAGVAQAEVERFTPVIREIADHLGASLVIIEHDIPLMMSLVDRLYVLAAGEVIAEGLPEDVGTDPAVIAAYLGTDERVVRRSGRVGTPAASTNGTASDLDITDGALLLEQPAPPTSATEILPEQAPTTSTAKKKAKEAPARRLTVQERRAAALPDSPTEVH